jgi:hypothetical protein
MEQRLAVEVVIAHWHLSYEQAQRLYFHLVEGYTIPSALLMIGENNGSRSIDCSPDCFVCRTLRACLLAASSLD